MPSRNDILLTATEDLLPDLQNTFVDGHPALSKILDKLDTRQSGGEYAAFDVMIDGPGDAAQIVAGSESYTYGNRNVVRQGRVYIPESIYAYQVQGKDLRRMKGPQQVVKLLEKYPVAAMEHLKQETVRQFVTGRANINGLGGYTTINADQTFAPDGTALTGVIDYVGITSNQTVFNMVKQGGANGVTGWYNQADECSSWGTTTKRTVRNTYNKCKVRGGPHGPPDIGLTDGTSFNFYYESLDDQVRYQTSFKGEDGKDPVEGLMFHEEAVFQEVCIDDGTALFTTAVSGGAFSGVWFHLNTKTWHMLHLGEDDEQETKGLFSVRTVGQLQGRDAFGHEIVLAMQPYCNFLKANGVSFGTLLP